MTRRVWVGGLVAIALVAVWWTQRAAPYGITQSADQNVLLVTIDTLRADALGSYGGVAATPNLDALAAAGARFTFAHAHAVVTLPSHTSILTGALPYEHGIRDNSGFRVKDGTRTLATRLQAQGFATGAFIGGFPLTRRFGLAQGFDTFDDQISELAGDAQQFVPERPAPEVVDRALGWIADQSGKFFGWVHVFDPHSPYAPPEQFRSQYPDQPYHGEVAWVDQALGPLFEQLATLSRPTLVIVTSDHGESLGEHGEATHGMFAYEATLRVPLIIATVTPGGRTTRGRVIDTPARHVDIAPTVLEAIGTTDMADDGPWSGVSLRDVIRDGDGPDRPNYFESMTYNLVRGWAPLRGVLVERDKYIDQPIPELYDLGTDPAERINAAESNAERRQILENVLRTYDEAPPDRPGRETPEAIAALGSLGYISGEAPARATYTEADDLKNLVGIDTDLHRATELFQTGQTTDAITLLRSVIERRPDTADAYIALSYAYWQSGQWPTAIETLESGISGGAPDRDLRIKLGIYLAESGIDLPRAIAVLETLPGTDVETLNGLGVAYGRAGRFEDAARTFRKILVVDSGSGLANQNIAAMLLEQARQPGAPRGLRLVEAERYARRALDLDPLLARGHTTLGVILAQTNRRPEAIEKWRQAVRLDPAEFDALYNLVVLLVESGRIGEARTYGDQYLNTAPPQLSADAEAIRRLLNR